jgi:hypothetical protein
MRRAIVAAPILVGDLDLVGDYDASRRRWVCLQALHLNVTHHPFLTLAECLIDGGGIRTIGSATIPAIRFTAAATNTPKTIWRLVCLGRLKCTAENSNEPGSEKVEYHGEVGCDYRDESLSGTPCAS